MAQVTNLNVAPYFDDFDEKDNFHKVLFRPGFAIQARELTTLQSILQNQIERHGSHMFKEGSVVIPGQVSYSDSYFSVKLQSTFADEQIRIGQYLDFNNPLIVTGETTGVKAKITNVGASNNVLQPYLYGDLISAGTDGERITFANGENLSVNIATQHTTSYAADTASLKTFVESNPNISCVQTGSAVTVENGVYFIRGQFVRCQKQTLVLSPNSNIFTARIGFIILERLEVPEFDTTLSDNSTGSANYAAKGAHRLKLKLRLTKLPLNAPIPDNFVELMQLKRGKIVKQAKTTEYSVIGDELARRTYDESGDYTTKPFTFKIEEQIDNDYKGRTYKGTYGVTTGSRVITDDNILASEALLNLNVSTGKAYVKGYEVEKIAATNITMPKARSFKTVNAGVSTFNVGNFANVTNVYGSPDIGEISGETTPYKEIELFTDFTSVRGDATRTNSDYRDTTRGYQIGVARARTMEFKSGTQGNTDAIYKLFLFDLRMLTFLRLNTVSDTITEGAQVTGESSGATGFLYDFHNDAGHFSIVKLTNVIGNFSQGEKLKISDSLETDKILESDADVGPDGIAANTDITIAEITGHKFEEVRSFFMEDSTAAENFSADAVLALVDDEGKILLDGTDDNALDEFDQMITDGESVVFETQRVAKLIEPEKNISIFKLPKNTIKTLLTAINAGSSDTQYTVRRQFIGTTNSSGVVSFTATGSNETFVGFTDRDYMCTVLTAGGGTAVAGNVILLTGKVTGTSTTTLTITDSTLLGSGAKVKVIATILKTGVIQKNKTTNLCKQLKVIASDADGQYGTRATDRDISLGRVDAYKLVAVYDSEDTSADATIPSMTTTSITGTFARGEKIVGASSGAQARILTTTSPISYALEGNSGAINFVTGEVITGAASKATATVGVVTVGSKVITNSFTFDTGQRDNYYDISRITRKKGAAIPLGRLLVVYDFLSHGSGDVFTVDSYSPLNGQMEFDNIPIYTATKVDPDAPEPTGTLPLRDSFDFRPAVANITGTSTAIATVDQITGQSFYFGNRSFSGTGATVVDCPKPASSIQADFEFFVGYRAAVYLARNGKFIVERGVSDEIPKPPKDVNDTLKLASIEVPPFTFTPFDVRVKRYKTQRFTMRDIGRIKDRVERLEDLTALTLLEKSAESFEIQDQNGLNRFKSGFLVDNFKGHRVGAALNPDYKVAVDIINGELRPKCVMRNVTLKEVNITDADRISHGYQKTGDLITLPYTSVASIDQPFGTRIENVQPYSTPNWVGHVIIQPSGDDWFETETAPTITNNVMGDYDTVLAENQNSLGTFWNAWEIVSVGVDTDTSQAWVDGGTDSQGYFTNLVETSISTSTTDKKQTGVTNTIVEDVVFTNNTSISSAIIPYVRSRKIKFIGECFMPNKRVYIFFDGVDVNAFSEPLNSDFTNQTLVADGTDADQGKNLVTNAVGKIEGFFTIPEHSFSGQENVPKFETQKDLELRITSSPINAKAGYNGATVGASTAGATTYSAIGVLETTQDTITATKNGKIVSTAVDQTTSVTETGSAYTTTIDSVYTQTVFPQPDPPPDVEEPVIEVTTIPVTIIDDVTIVTSPPPDDDEDEVVVVTPAEVNTTPHVQEPYEAPDFVTYQQPPDLTPYEEAAFGTTTEDFYSSPDPFGSGTSNQNDDEDESSGGWNFSPAAVQESVDYVQSGYEEAAFGGGTSTPAPAPAPDFVTSTPSPAPSNDDDGGGGGGGGDDSIICTALNKLGYLPDYIYNADQQFGEMIRNTDPKVYQGYLKWAEYVVGWLESKDESNIMPWIKDDKTRIEKTKQWALNWTVPIATPWATEMAYQMGKLDKGSYVGKLLMVVGKSICRHISKENRKVEKKHLVILLSILGIARFISLFSFTNYTKNFKMKIKDL